MNISYQLHYRMKKLSIITSHGAVDYTASFSSSPAAILSSFVGLSDQSSPSQCSCSTPSKLAAKGSGSLSNDQFEISTSADCQVSFLVSQTLTPAQPSSP